MLRQIGRVFNKPTLLWWEWSPLIVGLIGAQVLEPAWLARLIGSVIGAGGIAAFCLRAGAVGAVTAKEPWFGVQKPIAQHGIRIVMFGLGLGITGVTVSPLLSDFSSLRRGVDIAMPVNAIIVTDVEGGGAWFLIQRVRDENETWWYFPLSLGIPEVGRRYEARKSAHTKIIYEMEPLP